MKKNFKELKNEELENVNGGAMQCFDKKTYAELGMSLDELGTNQVVTNHPLVVTWGNRCGGWTEGNMGHKLKDCFHCKYMQGGGSHGWKSYCKNRSRELDRYK